MIPCNPKFEPVPAVLPLVTQILCQRMNHIPAKPPLWQIITTHREIMKLSLWKFLTWHFCAIIADRADDPVISQSGIKFDLAIRAPSLRMFHNVVENFCQNLLASVTDLRIHARAMLGLSGIFQRGSNGYWICPEPDPRQYNIRRVDRNFYRLKRH